MKNSPPAIPYFYRRLKSGQILPRFTIPLALQALWFQNGAIYRKSKNAHIAQMIAQNSDQHSSPIPPKFLHAGQKKQNFAQFYRFRGCGLQTDQ